MLVSIKIEEKIITFPHSGPFTQLVWGATQKFGCGKARNSNGKVSTTNTLDHYNNKAPLYFHPPTHTWTHIGDYPVPTSVPGRPCCSGGGGGVLLATRKQTRPSNLYKTKEMILLTFFQFHSEVTPHVAPGEVAAGQEKTVKTQN